MEGLFLDRGNWFWPYVYINCQGVRGESFSLGPAAELDHRTTFPVGAGRETTLHNVDPGYTSNKSGRLSNG